mmetsp:Transcript_81911/g.237542  ORF Transcript_81911/g.237542 Transcript_81911/m.237542 type:complete len:275 (-) Transcript_81911:70-894(-)
MVACAQPALAAPTIDDASRTGRLPRCASASALAAENEMCGIASPCGEAWAEVPRSPLDRRRADGCGDHGRREADGDGGRRTGGGFSSVPSPHGRIGAAELGTLMRSPSEQLSRGAGTGRSRTPAALAWHTRSGFSPASFQQAGSVPLGLRDLEKELRWRVAFQGTAPFTATSTQRLSFVRHPVTKEQRGTRAGGTLCRQVRREQRPPGQRQPEEPPKDRHELTSNGEFHRWSAEEMQNCRGVATFSGNHTTVKRGEDARRRPATLGRHLDYYRS